MKSIQAINEENSTHGVNFDRLPDECPHCHKKITPNYGQAFLNSKNYSTPLQIIFRCPNHDCYNVFIGYYDGLSPNYYFKFTEPLKFVPKEFSQIINQISSDFISIYNQAYAAEQKGLDVICGVGYRKALEFLIKDYLISQKPDEAEEIKKIFLGKIINDRVGHRQLKEVAKRAVWLGNDEVHYERKWQDKDLTDLKDLIELTIRWIETDKLTEKLLQDMPEEKK